VSFALAVAALVFWALAFARYVRLSRPRDDGPRVTFLDLPLGLAVNVRLDLSAVAARERVRSAFLRTGAFRVEAAEGGRMSFRQGDRPSPWLGRLRGAKWPAVYVGSFGAEAAAPSGCQLLLRFSTVPVAGWALAGFGLVGLLGFAAHLAGLRGLWFWVSLAVFALGVRAGYQAEVRRLAWGLLDLLALAGHGG